MSQPADGSQLVAPRMRCVIAASARAPMRSRQHAPRQTRTSPRTAREEPPAPSRWCHHRAPSTPESRQPARRRTPVGLAQKAPRFRRRRPGKRAHSDGSPWPCRTRRSGTVGCHSPGKAGVLSHMSLLSQPLEAERGQKGLLSRPGYRPEGLSPSPRDAPLPAGKGLGNPCAPLFFLAT